MNKHFEKTIHLSELLIFLIVILSCSLENSVNPEEQTPVVQIEFEEKQEYYYRFFHDSLYTDWVALENGIDPDTVTALFGSLESVFVYDFRTLPNPAWVERVSCDNPNNYEECYLNAETLYCPSDTNFINWLIACPNSDF